MNFRSPSLALRLRTTLALIAASFALSGPASHAQAPQGLPKPLADFLEQHCLKCHDAETKKGSLDLSSLPSPSHNATSLGAWENVFDRVAEQEMPPPKKTQPKPGERQAFLNFLQGDLLAADRRRIASTGRVQSRRLTRSEFERSVQDVLGLYIPFQSHLPEDPLTDGFSTVAKGQQVSSNQLDTYLEVIDEALDAAFNQALTAREAWKTTLSWNELQRHNVPNVNVSRGPEGRPSQQDVVSWSTASRADFYGRMEATKVPENGWYKIRVRALAVNPPQGTRVSASLFAGKHISTAPERHLAGILEASATPEDFEFISWMHAKELLRLQVCDNTQRRPPAPRHPQNREMHEDLDGKGYVGVALQSLEMERVYPAWSPEDTRRALFGSLPVQPRPVSKNSAGKRKDSPASELDVVSENPARDLQSLVLLFANRAFRHPVQPNEIAGYVELAKAKLQS
ncbi:MAG: hypothetical protein RLZZ244_1171, partial [Verrucomicrobiota bacterium]